MFNSSIGNVTGAAQLCGAQEATLACDPKVPYKDPSLKMTLEERIRKEQRDLADRNEALELALKRLPLGLRQTSIEALHEMGLDFEVWRLFNNMRG